MSRPRAYLLALALCLTLAGVHSPPAAAGRYEVAACGDDGVNRSWTLTYGGPGGYTTGASSCPGGPGGSGGIYVRSTGHPTAKAPGWTTATSGITAPPGTAIVALRGRAEMAGTLGWTAGIYDWGGNRWLWCGPGCLSTFGQWPTFASDGLWTSMVGGVLICGAQSCGRSGNTPAGLISLSHVVTTLEDTWQPSLSLAGGSLRQGGWHRGTQDLSWNASDNTGIRSVRVLLDGVQFGTSEHTCDPHSTTPCPNGGDRLALDTSAFAKRDGKHTLRIVAYDAGGNATAVDQPFYVDNNAPAQPIDAALTGGTGWRGSNSFAVSWRNPAQAASPITGARYQLCPEATALARKGCFNGSRDGAGVQSVADIHVPGPGSWTLRLWLRDQAGNEDSYRSVALDGLRFDNAAPSVVFATPNAEDPTLIRVTASDIGSGLAHTEILMRRRGTTTWTSLPTSPAAGGFAARIDDEYLARGTYELEARAADAAGNERSTRARENGSRATVALPLRIRTRLRVGKVKRIRALGARGKRRTRRVLIVKPRARFGRTITLHGRLTTPGGNPLVDSEIAVFEQIELPGAGRTRIASLRTSRTGRFTFKALRGPSRVLFFRYGGTHTIRARTTAVDLRIQASSTLRANHRVVRNGEYVTFRGRVKGHPLPADGKLVELQVFTRGQWRTFAQPRASAHTGRWSYAYRFEAVRGRARFRFRARIRKEVGFPYDLGVSRQRSVTVVGI